MLAKVTEVTLCCGQDGRMTVHRDLYNTYGSRLRKSISQTLYNKSSRSLKIMEDLDMFARVTRLHGKNGMGNPDMATKVCAFSRAVIS